MTQQITIKQASEITKKSVHTIKKLVQEKKLLFTKIKGKRGNEIRIFLPDLIKYYELENIEIDDDINSNKKLNIEKLLPNILPNNSNEPDMFSNLDEADNENKKEDRLEQAKLEIENLKLQNEKLFAEIESRRVEAGNLHRLLENQQILTKGLQEQLKISNSDKNSNSYQDSYPIDLKYTTQSDINISNQNEQPKYDESYNSRSSSPNIERKWWQIWK